MSLGLKFPFQESSQGGIFATTKTSAEAIRANLLSLLTTKRGHRVMNNRLYSPLYDYIFEPFDTITETELDKELREKISEFISEIVVSNITYDFNEQDYVLTVNVIYTIPSLGDQQDNVSLSLNIDDAQ